MFYILGNGPSLTTRVIGALPDGAWLGMNSAFRYWHKIGKYPRYYACLDPVVVKSQFNGIRELFDRPEITDFFLHDCIAEIDPQAAAHPKVTLLSAFLARTQHAVPISRLALEKQTTGALATRFVLDKGHRNLNLIGIDCKYVERVEESTQTQGIELVITKKVTHNPNYFFNDYQAAGDKYQVPNPAVHTGNLHLQSFVALRNDIDSTGEAIHIEVGSPRSLLSRFGIFPIRSIWQRLGIRRIGAIAVPLTPREWRRQIQNLQLWLDPKLRPSVDALSRGTCLHLFLSGPEDQELRRNIAAAVDDLPELRDFFAGVRITFLGIPAEIDHYVRNAAGSDEPSTKSGPNVFFLATMAHCREYEYVLHAETDCLPVRTGWLDAAEGEIDRAGNQAWIIGPAYFHSSHLHSAYRLHINGNAIYQTGDPDFQQFLETTFFDALGHLVRSGFRDMAYDTALAVLLYNLNALPAELKSKLMLALPRFTFSNFIRNVGGTKETADPTLVDIRGLLEESDATYMLHGRPGFHHLDGDRSLLPALFRRLPTQREDEMPLFWAGGGSKEVTVTALGYGTVDLRRVSAGAGAAVKATFSMHFIRVDPSPGTRSFEASFAFAGPAPAQPQVRFVLRSAAGISRECPASSVALQSESDRTTMTVRLKHVDVGDAVTVGLVLPDFELTPACTEFVQARMREVRDAGARAEHRLALESAPRSEAAAAAIEHWRTFYQGLPRVRSALQPYWLHWASDAFLVRNVTLQPGIVDMTFASGGVGARKATTPLLVAVIANLKWTGVKSFNISLRIPRPVNGKAVVRLCRHGQQAWEYSDIEIDIHAGLGTAKTLQPLFAHEHQAFRVELLRLMEIEGQFGLQIVVEWEEAPSAPAPTRPASLQRWTPRPPAKESRILLIDPTLMGSPSATGQVKSVFFQRWQPSQILQIWEPFAADGSFAVTRFDKPGHRDLHALGALEKICAEFDPDIVYVRPDDNLRFLSMSCQVVDAVKRPVMLHLMDDWMERARVKDTERCEALTELLARLVTKSALHLSICPSMSRMLSLRYGSDWIPLANGVHALADVGTMAGVTPQAPFTVRYMGGLAKDMSMQTVRMIAEAVEQLPAEPPVRFEVYTMDWYRADAEQQLRAFGRTSIQPLVDAGQYAETLSSAGTLVIAYNFDQASIAYTRYSFSNKLPECLASGRPVLMVGPADVSTVAEFKDSDAVVQITEPSVRAIADAIATLAQSPARCAELAAKAATLVRERFLATDVAAKMQRLADDAIATARFEDSAPVVEKPRSFAEANQLLREGKFEPAFRAYVQLLVQRDLQVYRENALICLRKLGLEAQTLDHAVMAARQADAMQAPAAR